MSFKNYRKGTKRVLDQALENSRHVYANYKISLSKHPCNLDLTGSFCTKRFDRN